MKNKAPFNLVRLVPLVLWGLSSGCAKTSSAGSAGSAAADAGAKAAAPLTASTTCEACESAKCPSHRTYCDAFSGDQRAACNQVVACVRKTNCHANGTTLDCYCGTADSEECLRPGGARGACKADIEAAQGTADPGVVQARYDDVKFPGGAALSFMLCDAIVCKADCVPYFRSR